MKTPCGASEVCSRVQDGCLRGQCRCCAHFCTHQAESRSEVVTQYSEFHQKWNDQFPDEPTLEMLNNINYYYYCLAYHLRNDDCKNCARDYLALPKIDPKSSAFEVATAILNSPAQDPQNRQESND